MKALRFALLAIAAASIALVGCKKEAQNVAPQNKPANGATAGKPMPKTGATPSTWKAPTTSTAPVSTAPAAPMSDEYRAGAQQMLDKGIEFLLSKTEADGGWSAGGGVYKPAITGLVLKVLLDQPSLDRTKPLPEHITKGFDVLLKYRQPDGGIYEPKEGQAAYTTSIAIMALAAAKNPQYAEIIDKAVAYTKGIQIKEGTPKPGGGTVAADDPNVGGVGYGSDKQSANLSTLSFAMAGWEAGGVPKDDPNVQAAAGFLTRLQNNSETNSAKWAQAGKSDGGFVYSPRESKGGGEGEDGMRSYGSMTYAGFKGMLYAGVSKDDPRIRAAYKWIRNHWSLENNPNMPDKQSQEGLYYYYHVFAKALRHYGDPVISDGSGNQHNWRHELVDALKARLQEQGFWKNDKDRWQEGSEILVTCYSLLALEEVLK